MRRNRAKQVMRDGKATIGTWLSLGNIPSARLMARAGFDWLTVDVEHSLVNIETTTHMMAAIADAGCVALARVPSNRHDHIKRMLDNGAHGIVVPMVNTREEAEAAVAACLYPPRGNRSVGGSMHAINFDATATDYYANVNDELLIVLQCEHIDAVNRADDIFSVPGIDAIFVGPNDLAASMRDLDGKPPSPEAFSDALRRIREACERHGLAAGLHCGSAAEAKLRLAEGWRMLAVASELKFMVDGAANVLQTIGWDGAAKDLAKY
ncbi:HpcH/HpaI aldolase family protein [Tuwongella immobilis]|uniref:HpcH/HpaI aldolase/citrate lyase domain-containing protein n=1 Tax=Tuwongella immobilis TaxID=692036 RepID=A0A6C2YKP3_9BACT|nr:aldolase/citrate lyase family protein [Tuwongella immobilis]VIP01799.1 2-dehydro-3-deoxyglucarate aldolase : 4-hydroxy-2-oxovalerate aldolase OS=Isosphaera pallida (strain ATCC 43644 / DSM 9630 / IS1B) GN=Isop_1054 PE=4 SV=1: HpcH_HpaI [Tuwongella immobilis]VTR99486.1 2-dehydro-3-deoxyglucarate aldolase : 4-hydroxy-2-oxovalerate aldolase OS=Isosphaera pallida (strain ATCC 43644 / DSM 9630 / IS1B) GN=Isop_1054 PE=4 SV=1: HpcH_HpaI [Tuwongella immobilis]